MDPDPLLLSFGSRYLVDNKIKYYSPLLTNFSYTVSLKKTQFDMILVNFFPRSRKISILFKKNWIKRAHIPDILRRNKLLVFQHQEQLIQRQILPSLQQFPNHLNNNNIINIIRYYKLPCL